jgi:hypothetical protein
LGTSTITWITARDIRDLTQRAAHIRLSIGRSFMERQCMIRMGMRLMADIGNGS